MIFLITLICAFAACYALKPLILKCPTAFYVLAFALEFVYLGHVTGIFTLPRAVWMVFFELIQECTLALALFMVVMFVGVFGNGNKFGQRLKAIRGELSIIAWILTLGHVIFYFQTMLNQLIKGTAGANIYLSFIVAVALLILLMLLGITSFKFVKKHMSSSVWRKIQKFAYLFTAFVFIHLAVLLLPSALGGGIAAQQSVVIYSVVFIGYAVARVARAKLDAVEASRVQEDSVEEPA